MPNLYGRSSLDRDTYLAAFALPAAASGVTQSTGFDFGTDALKTANIELELVVPALSATIVPDTRTVTVTVETSTTSVFTAVAREIYRKVQTGAGGAGVPAYNHLVRLPSDCEQYVRAKVTFGALTTDGSAVSATFRILF